MNGKTKTYPSGKFQFEAQNPIYQLQPDFLPDTNKPTPEIYY